MTTIVHDLSTVPATTETIHTSTQDISELPASTEQILLSSSTELQPSSLQPHQRQ